MSIAALAKLPRLPFAVSFTLLVAACAQPPAPPDAPKPVRVQQVVLADAKTSESYTGAVRAHVESDVAFRVGGKVIQRHVEVGQQVRAGQVIAELDSSDYGLGVAAALNQQQAAAVDAEQAASDATRFARLLSEGAVSQGDAERQRARADAARERLDQARRQAELARNRAGYAVLRAPFDGVVTALRLEAGQVVSEGQPVVTLAAKGEREIVIDLPETRVIAAKRSAATASLWASDGARFTVTLRELSPVASAATRTYRARYRIGADAPPMELGMTATVWLGSAGDGRRPAVATLPASALYHRDGRAAVWTVEAKEGAPTLVPVEVIGFGQEDVQVTGLTAGQLVAIAGVQKLTPQMKVVAVDGSDRPVLAQATPSLVSAQSSMLAR
jgi:RND family efflux transporter MFP subunit